MSCGFPTMFYGCLSAPCSYGTTTWLHAASRPSRSSKSVQLQDKARPQLLVREIGRPENWRLSARLKCIRWFPTYSSQCQVRHASRLRMSRDCDPACCRYLMLDVYSATSTHPETMHTLYTSGATVLVRCWAQLRVRRAYHGTSSEHHEPPLHIPLASDSAARPERAALEEGEELQRAVLTRQSTATAMQAQESTQARRHLTYAINPHAF